MDNITANMTAFTTNHIGAFTSLLSMDSSLAHSLSSYFNIPTGLIGMVMFLGISPVFFLFAYFWFRSILVSNFFAMIPLVAGALMGIIPMWIAAMFSIVSFYTVWSSIMGVPELSGVATEPSIGSEWDEYGQRIKDAYSAKFGGENNGFNDEVNNRIAIMNHNGRGFTRTIAYDWLKRMSKFTEAK